MRAVNNNERLLRIQRDGQLPRGGWPEQNVAIESRIECEITSTFLGRDQVNVIVLALAQWSLSFTRARARAQRSGARNRNRMEVA